MALFRKILFWTHLAIGIVAGVVILLLSVTGVLLTYQHQITNWADKRTYHLAANTGNKVPIERALASAAGVAGRQPTNAVVRRDPASAIEIGFGRDRVLMVDPYSANVVSEGASGTRTFFRVATNVHRTLGWHNAGGKVRHELVRVSNLLFLIQVITGAYLWFPRTLAWRHFRSVMLFRSKVTGRARDFNWHNVIGFWMLVPLFVIVITGVVMSYPWANALLYRATGSPLPAQNARPGGQLAAEGRQGARIGTPPDIATFRGLEESFDRLTLQAPEWRVISFRPPGSAGEPVTFNVEAGVRGRPDKRSQWTFSRDGELVKRETFADNSAGRRLRMWVRFGHTGEVGGIPGQTLAGIASAGACVLVITGFTLGLRRFSAWRNRSREGKLMVMTRGSERDYARRA